MLIPAYQPDEKMIELCRSLIDKEISAIIPRILIVDDGSGKEYADIFDKAADLGALILHHDTNRGKGASIKTGLTYIIQNLNEQVIVTADADGQHKVPDIEKVALLTSSCSDTLVLGVRDISRMPLRSRAGNIISRFFFKCCTGVFVSDTQTGLRGFSAKMADKLLLVEGERYEYEMNMLLQLKNLGFKYKEIGIDTVYIENNASTHFHAVKDGLRVFSRVLKYSAASILSAVLDFSLYYLFLHYFSISASYITARVFSGLFNYECNRRAVFKAGASVGNIAGYAILCVACMLLGSWLVKLLCGIGIAKLISKLMVDSVLFIMNYNIQKHFIFKNGKN